MRQIFYISLILITLCSPLSGQSGARGSTQNFTSISDITSIPLSDNLSGKKGAIDEPVEKSGRPLTVPYADSAGSEEKKRYWVEAEYLNWRIKGSYLPPLAQRGSSSPGASNAVDVGDREVNPGYSAGGRIMAGLWLNQSRTVGIEAGYFYIGPRSFNQGVNTFGESLLNFSPVIFRPYKSAVLSEPPYVIHSSLYTRGSLVASMASHLQGAEFNTIYEVGERSRGRVRLIGGFRFLDLKERLTVIENHVFSGQRILGQGSDRFYLVTDEFDTRNRFYGGQGGVRTEFSRGKLRLEFSGKVALGGVVQLVNISGSTFRNGRPTRIVGGFLALVTNSGRYERSRFAVLPEAKGSIGYQLTDNLQAFAGYDFLYINRVARPAEQVDLTINWHNIPTLRIEEGPPIFAGEPSLPEFKFSDSPFGTHGLTVGLRVRF